MQLKISIVLKYLKMNLIWLLIPCLSLAPLSGKAPAEIRQWPQETNLTEETTINRHDQVKVNPGSILRLDNINSKLNIKGQLIIKGSENKPTTIIIPNPIKRYCVTTLEGKTQLKSNNELTELEVFPYSIDTKEPLEELRAFRYQYAFVWTVLMGICFYLVVNRASYW